MTDFVAPQAGDMIKAIGFNAPHTIDKAQALLDIDVAVPELREFDVLVKVSAVSVNPADTKIRQTHTPQAGNHRILGYDASGVVVALGRGVRILAWAIRSIMQGRLTDKEATPLIKRWTAVSLLKCRPIWVLIKWRHYP